ncbi:hypothetical protein p2A17 (plasmid) [Aromatoleum aromaticum EbN1]|uniref:Uncharacterized protein n=1 Tax=Aromatoleum aromaticum (strain DSM 19018 / LMG 30748 / EbN1) TaxID=76114 RepID=Q5NWM9_AROAE|nr:hypothetical protein p2A17 [Aromatoleum aromaticum EbN1]
MRRCGLPGDAARGAGDRCRPRRPGRDRGRAAAARGGRALEGGGRARGPAAGTQRQAGDRTFAPFFSRSMSSPTSATFTAPRLGGSATLSVASRGPTSTPSPGQGVERLFLRLHDVRQHRVACTRAATATSSARAGPRISKRRSSRWPTTAWWGTSSSSCSSSPRRSTERQSSFLFFWVPSGDITSPPRSPALSGSSMADR